MRHRGGRRGHDEDGEGGCSGSGGGGGGGGGGGDDDDDDDDDDDGLTTTMKMVSTKVRIAAGTYFETISDGNDDNKSERKKVILKEKG